MNKKRKKNECIGVIDGKALVQNASGKLGQHDPLVRAGTGKHKNKRKYDRKGKNNQRVKHSLKEYGSSVIFFAQNFFKYSYKNRLFLFAYSVYNMEGIQ